MSTIEVEILILENANIQVRNNGHLICEGTKDECMNKLRHEVYNLQGLTGKSLIVTVKAWPAYSSNPKLIADSISFFRNHLNMLKSSTNVSMKIQFKQTPNL